MEPSFCQRLPKLELHAHLNGSLTHETLKELYDYHKENYGRQILDLDISLFNQNFYSISEFFKIFKVTYMLTSTPESVKIATMRVIEDFSKDNIIYLELRSTLRKENDMTKRQYLESLIDGVLSCKIKFPNISVKLIISINRSESVDSAKENIYLTIEYFKKYPEIIVGVDVSGNPKGSSFKDFIELLETARNAKLKLSVHCAEIVDSKEVEDILDFYPDRIGHGTCIHESNGGNQIIWNDLLKKKIPVELCLTSNIKCKTIESFDKHHFKLLYEAKHPIILATDDKGVFCSTLSNEFEIVKKTFGLHDEELWRLSYNSIDYIFSDDDEKDVLKTILNQWKIGNL